MTETTLVSKLDAGDFLVAPGVPDTLSALLAEQLGFPLVFLSGSAMAATHLGVPDIGLMSVEEIATVMRQVRERTDIPVIVDADSGFGNAYNVARTVRTLELAGASAIQIEDMVNDKHPDEVTQRPVIPLADMCDKLAAALDSRHSESTLISARTDVNITQGIDAVTERISAFIESGVDLVFAEGLASDLERNKICKEVDGRVPIIYNTAWPATSAPSIPQLKQEGFTIALAPKTVVSGIVNGVVQSLAELRSITDLESEIDLPENIEQGISSVDYLNQLITWRK